MPRERWMQLTNKQRQLWDKLNDKAKSIILGLSATPKSAPPGETPRRSVNLHEMSAHEFLQAFAAETVDEVTESNAEGITEEFHDSREGPEDTAESQILINAAKTGK